MSRVEVVVSGYASLDEAYTATRLAGAAETGILRGDVRPSARPGGCGPNTARVLAQQGVRTGAVTWLGDDAQGHAFLAGLKDAGVDVTGVEMGRGASPRSLLIYDQDGEAACYFHPSRSADQRLTAALLDQLTDASWLAVTVGPASLTGQLLEALGPRTRLAWNVKADPHAFPPDLCRRLVQADLVCLNRGEFAFVADALDLGADADASRLLGLGAGVVVLTEGAGGYRVVTDRGSERVRVKQVAVKDPTGAGDAFLAGLIAGLLRQETPARAAERGASAARDFLLSRSHTGARVAK